jgi:hypothetical protein
MFPACLNPVLLSANGSSITRKESGYNPVKERDHRAEKESFLSTGPQRNTELRLISKHKTRQWTIVDIQHNDVLFAALKASYVDCAEFLLMNISLLSWLCEQMGLLPPK